MTEPTGPEVAYRSTPEEFTKGRWASLEDHVLLERVLAGQPLAFEVLMERYSPMVIGTLYNRVATPADAEDLAQEIFLTAYRGLGQLRSAVSFRPWLMHILNNKLIDYYRMNSRRPQLVTGERPDAEAGEDGLLAQFPSPAADPGRQAHAAETRAIILREIDALGEKFSVVLHLRLFEELASEEIAGRLGLTSTGVRMRLFRGLRRLRKALQKHGIGIV